MIVGVLVVAMVGKGGEVVEGEEGEEGGEDAVGLERNVPWWRGRGLVWVWDGLRLRVRLWLLRDRLRL